MILPASFENAWIQQISKTIGKRGDPKLIEKIIYAFALLEQLQLSGLDLIFKGGTSVFLMSDSPSRFSIDVDIIVSLSPENMSAYFDKVVDSGSFLNWQEDNERKIVAEAPVGHYKFYYKSIIGSHFGYEPILLDVLFSPKSNYKKTIKIPIRHKWLICGDPYVLVTVPSIESVLGDKLTAFAPNTTGILYSKNRPVEIIKQLFDIAYLFDKANDFQEVRESFLDIAAAEILYRNLSIKPADVLRDAFNTALLIARRDNTSDNFNFLQKGIGNIVNFIITPFRLEEAIICASKVAYLTQLLIQEVIPTVFHFSSPAETAGLSISYPDYTKFNRYKISSPEAFYYWHQALKLLKPKN
jgi:hypothetical protein